MSSIDRNRLGRTTPTTAVSTSNLHQQPTCSSSSSSSLHIQYVGTLRLGTGGWRLDCFINHCQSNTSALVTHDDGFLLAFMCLSVCLSVFFTQYLKNRNIPPRVLETHLFWGKRSKVKVTIHKTLPASMAWFMVRGSIVSASILLSVFLLHPVRLIT